MVGGLCALIIQGVLHLFLVAVSLVKGLTNCNPFVLFGLLCTWFCLLFPSLSPLLFLPFFHFVPFSFGVACHFSFLFFALQGWGLDIPIPFLSSGEGYPGHQQTGTEVVTG